MTGTRGLVHEYVLSSAARVVIGQILEDVPAHFCFGTIVPLLKDKHGDASQLHMYRGITLSSTVSKLFESVLVALFRN